MTPAAFISSLAFFHRKSLGNTEALLLYNLIYQDIQSRASWTWLQEAATLTAVDSALIDLPSDLRRVWEVRVDGEVYRPIHFLEREKYTAGSNPRKYYLFGKQIGFPGYSNPDASNNVDVRYIKIGADLTAVGESSLAPSTLDPAFVEFGVGYLWQREGNYGKAGNHLALAEQIVNTVKAENNKPIKGEMRGMRHIEDFYPRTH